MAETASEEGVSARVRSEHEIMDWQALYLAEHEARLAAEEALARSVAVLRAAEPVREIRETRAAERLRLAAIVDSSNDAILSKTLNGIITTWNPAAERIFGYTAEEAIGQPKTLLFPPDRLEEEVVILECARKGVQTSQFETVRRRKDGALIDVSLTISPIRDDAGTIIGASTIARDITEQKRIQQQVRELNAQLSRAMRETHHRVKNNLQLIAAMLDMSLMDFPDALPRSEVKGLSSRIITLAAIHDLLTRTARETGEHADALGTRRLLCHLLDMLADSMEQYQIHEEIQDIRVTVHQATALALTVNELVSNAIKHGGAQIRVILYTDEGQAIVKVEDDGPGFPHAFDVHTSANTGLALVENLVHHDLGGTLRFGNSDTGGARVCLQVPLRA